MTCLLPIVQFLQERGGFPKLGRFDIGEVIDYRNGVAANLPDDERLKHLSPPGASIVA